MTGFGPPYARPPITEAVVEIRFKASFSARDLDRMRDKFKGRYPSVEERHEVNVRVEGKTSTSTAKKVGYKKRWSRFLRQVAKVDPTTRRMIHHEDAQTVHGRVQGESRA
jgi:uncharacterized protein (TIGR04255 family)